MDGVSRTFGRTRRKATPGGNIAGRLAGLAGCRRGAVAVLSVAAMVAVCGLAALAVDMGNLAVNRVRVANIADSAVLAGVQNLPASPATARALAGQYAAVNGLTAADVLTSAVSADGRQLTVTVSRRVQFYFARALNLAGGNFDGATVTARASAGLAVASGARDIVPFGIVRQNLVYGSRYVLKEGAGGGYNGNFGALALGGRGASVYRLNIQEGYDGVIRVGDYLTTETGNMSGPTRTGVNYRISLDPCATYQTVQRGSPRIVTVPIIDSLAVNGRSQVLVVGFASFFLEGVGGNGNLNYVEGRFMQMIDPLAETDTGSQAAGDYGLYRVRLVQ